MCYIYLVPCGFSLPAILFPLLKTRLSSRHERHSSFSSHRNCQNCYSDIRAFLTSSPLPLISFLLIEIFRKNHENGRNILIRCNMGTGACTQTWPISFPALQGIAANNEEHAKICLLEREYGHLKAFYIWPTP